MAETLRESISSTSPAPTTATAVATTPVQNLAESSTVQYSKPATVTPAPTTTQTITSGLTPVGTMPTMTSKPFTNTAQSAPVSPLATRPIQINNLMIDPSIPLAQPAPTKSGSGGGGGGGSMSEEKPAGVKKINWLPTLLVAAGLIVLATKVFKKKKAD